MNANAVEGEDLKQGPPALTLVLPLPENSPTNPRSQAELGWAPESLLETPPSHLSDPTVSSGPPCLTALSPTSTQSNPCLPQPDCLPPSLTDQLAPAPGPWHFLSHCLERSTYQTPCPLPVYWGLCPNTAPQGGWPSRPVLNLSPLHTATSLLPPSEPRHSLSCLACFMKAGKCLFTAAPPGLAGPGTGTVNGCPSRQRLGFRQCWVFWRLVVLHWPGISLPVTPSSCPQGPHLRKPAPLPVTSCVSVL